MPKTERKAVSIPLLNGAALNATPTVSKLRRAASAGRIWPKGDEGLREEADNWSAICLRASGEYFVYTWYETDCHLPRALMAESGMPQCAAVVAAPIRKECGEMWR